MITHEPTLGLQYHSMMVGYGIYAKLLVLVESSSHYSSRHPEYIYTQCRKIIDIFEAEANGTHRPRYLKIVDSMVYNGPSTGCEKCRERHTKCDETKPACKKCKSGGYTCPGYRDFCGIVFKDVSRSIFARQSRRAKKSSALSTSRIPAKLRLDAQTASINFFFLNYILTSHRDTLTSQGHFDYLMPLYSTAAPSSPLTLAKPPL